MQFSFLLWDIKAHKLYTSNFTNLKAFILVIQELNQSAAK